MNIEQVLDDNRDRLMAIPGVSGVGIGRKDDKPAIVIMVTQLTSDVHAMLPESIGGCPVVVEESGEITAF